MGGERERERDDVNPHARVQSRLKSVINPSGSFKTGFIVLSNRNFCGYTRILARRRERERDCSIRMWNKHESYYVFLSSFFFIFFY